MHTLFFKEIQWLPIINVHEPQPTTSFIKKSSFFFFYITSNQANPIFGSLVKEIQLMYLVNFVYN